MNPEALKILVLVHPGSACGSATFNLGNDEARRARSELTHELNAWTGGVIVIDGELSDELEGWPIYANAIEGALERARQAGHVSVRLDGHDPAHLARIREFVRREPELSHAADFTVSGAWYHPEDETGCVGTTVSALRALGCRAQVSDAAVCMPSEEDAVDLDVTDEPPRSRLGRSRSRLSL